MCVSDVINEGSYAEDRLWDFLSYLLSYLTCSVSGLSTNKDIKIEDNVLAAGPVYISKWTGAMNSDAVLTSQGCFLPTFISIHVHLIGHIGYFSMTLVE